MFYAYARLSPSEPEGCTDDYDCVHEGNNDCVITGRKYSNCYYCYKDSGKCIAGNMKIKLA